MTDPAPTPPERPRMDADIVCVGFGPAMGGFLTTLSRDLLNPDGSPAVESATMPGLAPQVICYERADDIAFGVSGVVTRGRGIRESFPNLDPTQIPMAVPVKDEKVLYLLDPIGASRRSMTLRLADRLIRGLKRVLPCHHDALELPYTPGFLHKAGGLVMSIGQFNQWVGGQVLATGTVQIWPGTPVAEAVIDKDGVAGVRLLDQGIDRHGQPGEGFAQGLEVRAALTVVGDGPVGAIGRQLDAQFGMPPGHQRHDWAIGMKMVVELDSAVDLPPGTVLHTFGFPEPEIFGFLYVHPDRLVSVGIFVPSWFDSPVRTCYRYLQHWMMHPYLWRYLKAAQLRSWGAKTLQESGRRGEPHLVGNGYVRIGEGSGSTNVLTGSGVDEAWTTGTQLAESVLQLLKEKKPFTRENLEATYVRRRRSSWVEREGRIAEKSRDGFHHGVLTGMVGLALTGLTNGHVNVIGKPRPPHQRLPDLEAFFRGKMAPAELQKIRKECLASGKALHDSLMDRCGWPAIPYDGKLLVSQQDALLLGGKVQAPPGYADHVAFPYPDVCAKCGTKICIEACSGQAITPGDHGVPAFDREKCIHCGACLWNCSRPHPRDPERNVIAFRAGAGGLHSAEN